MKRILFVCVENACRSQMAEGWAKHLGGGKIEVRSAGSKPSGRVNPLAVQVMQEAGVDIRAQKSKGLPDPDEGEWDVVVTMGCGDACPHIPAKRREDWTLPDPKGKPIAFFRSVRDDIHRRVEELLKYYI